jgi:hypothetical protein
VSDQSCLPGAEHHPGARRRSAKSAKDEDVTDELLTYQAASLSPDSATVSVPEELNSLDAPGLIYHYTDGEGLLGILNRKHEGRMIWASDLHLLNDSRELDYPISLIHPWLEELRTNYLNERATVPNRGTDESVYDLIQQRLTGSNDLYRVFAACFCESDDLLSQWRSYGSGGYAIGFSAEDLKQSHLESDGSTETRLALRKVAYGVESAARDLRGIKAALEQLSPWGMHGMRSHMFTLHQLLPEVARIKHSSWTEEQEWRLIVSAYRPQHLAPSFRVTTVGIVPFLKLVLPDAAVREVVIGPSSHPEARREGVQALVNAYAPDEKILVRLSLSSLRS